jgi:multimeric flavodoxin WrbA
MRMLTLCGSRDHQGRTAQAVSTLQSGFVKAGGTAESLFLIDQKLERCRQCDIDGWGQCRREGACIIEDDFHSIVDKIQSADVVVFATPVYFADLSEIMRSFLDRLRRIRFRRVPPSTPGGNPNGTMVVGLCLSGGGGGGSLNCSVNLERILLTCGFNILDIIPVRRQNFGLKLRVLELTGEWLATKPTSEESRQPR